MSGLGQVLYNMAMGGKSPAKEAWLKSLPVCPGAPYGLVIGVRRDNAGKLRTVATCTGCEESWFMPEDLP